MAHELYVVNGRAGMAYTGKTPWHGLGQALTEDASIETWQREAGMDWTVKRSRVRYATSAGAADETLQVWDKNHVLFRSDSQAPLAVVSEDYQVVQPKQVVEFFRDLIADQGFKLKTAGVLFGGQRFWAMAETGHEFRVLADADRVRGNLLLATSCDGSMRTTAQFTSVAVVCMNTLRAALADGKGAVKVSHRTKFNETQVKLELGVMDQSFARLESEAKALARRPITRREAVQALVNAFGDAAKFEVDLLKVGVVKALEEQPATRFMGDVVSLFLGNKARGGELEGRKGTAWGLLNAATETFDHTFGREQSNRLANAWFGQNADKKVAFKDELMKLAA